MNDLCVDFSQFSNSLKQIIIIPALPEGINMWVLHIKQHIRGGGLVYVLPIFVQFSIDQQPLSLFLKIPVRSVLRFSKINYLDLSFHTSKIRNFYGECFMIIKLAVTLCR